jgi:hypothetical protein
MLIPKEAEAILKQGNNIAGKCNNSDVFQARIRKDLK